MISMLRLSRLILPILALGFLPSAARAQQTTDSAHVLLETARVLQAEGYGKIARDVLGRLLVLFPLAPQADTARTLLGRTPEPEATQLGRTGFIAYHTAYGGFLGVAIPAALGADDPEPYGAGLMLGAPGGFFLSRLYSGSRNLSDGQAGTINFGSLWGTWQGFGWQEVLGIGDKEVCVDGEPGFCYDEESTTARWASAVVGGLTGLGVGLLAANKPISSGTSSLVFNSSLWGTWYGFAISAILEAEDEERLAAALVGGNAAILAAIPAAGALKPTRSQVRLASAGGAMGGVVGLGLAILTGVDDTKGFLAIVSGGTTLGLVTGGVLGRDKDDALASARPMGTALVNVNDGVRLGVPLPTPTLLRLDTARGRATTPGLRLTLLDARLP